MGDSIVKWALIGVCLSVAGGARAQSTYPQGAPYSDPRAASKQQSSSTPSTTYRGTPPAWTSGHPQPRGHVQRPTSPPARGYSATGYATPQARSQAYVLAPPVLPYREGVPTPTGYVLETHRNQGLIIGGVLTWAAAYAGGLIFAVSDGFDNGSGWLAAPLVGPWGAISSRDFRCKSSQNVTQKEIDQCVDGALGEVTSITFLAMMGLAQAVGATLLFVGVGDKTHEWVRADLADVKVKADAGRIGDSAYGLLLDGSF